MKKVKEKKLKEVILKTLIIIEAIIIIILLLRFDYRKTIAFNGNGAKGTMGQIKVYSNEEVTIEDNKFTNEGYNFTGWSIYNDKDNTWKCEEGWFTEEEMKEKEYQAITYTTEEINKYFNDMEKGKITAYANWNKISNENMLVNSKEEVNEVEEQENEEIKDECEKHFYFSKISKKVTCTENGIKTYTCMLCKDTYTEEIPAFGHQYIEKIIREPNSRGKIVKLYICIGCTHQYKEVISNECIEHIYSSKITKKATCTENGIKTYTCIDCKNVYTEEIPATGHDYTETILSEPTCEKNGLKGHLCLNCEQVYTEEIAKLEHKYTETVIKEATHEETGIKKIECSVCKNTYTEEIPRLEYSDLEKLQMALIGRQFSEEEIGNELIIDELLIKFGDQIFVKEPEILNILIYNGNEYTVYIDQNGIGLNVTENKAIEEKFKFDEWYSGIGDMDISIKINQNGDTTLYETSTLQFQGTQLQYAKVFENNIYFKEDGMYYWIGSVNETGTTITIGTGEDLSQLIYNPDFKVKIKQLEEENKARIGFYEGDWENDSDRYWRNDY